ncbi:MAG: hypothetical protein ACO3E4_03520 [Candidatus Nanopelagicaceae bacterium]|jgi:hypothetical protein
MALEAVAINRLSTELPIMVLFLVAIIAFLCFGLYSLYWVLRAERKFWLESNKNLQDRIDSLLDSIHHI